MGTIIVCIVRVCMYWVWGEPKIVQNNFDLDIYQFEYMLRFKCLSYVQDPILLTGSKFQVVGCVQRLGHFTLNIQNSRVRHNPISNRYILIINTVLFLNIPID